ncbi:MAG: universal stress protein [Methyloprofundus sp.]|nr:universal stress protein [Methyloprofundus sp.]
MYSKILVPIDTSYKSDYWLKAPLRTAYEMVNHPDGVIHVMSVIPHNILEGYYPNIYIKEVIDETKKKLEAIIEEYLSRGVRVDVSVEEGAICHEILRVAREESVDAIVIASHGPILKDYVIGSNAAHIAHHAHCSVVIVRDNAEE